MTSKKNNTPAKKSTPAKKAEPAKETTAAEALKAIGSGLMSKADAKKLLDSTAKDEPQLTHAERHEALSHALGADAAPDGTTTFYTGESVVTVTVSKRALNKGEDPREP